jgi:two-component system sensor histidine kinase DesK
MTCPDRPAERAARRAWPLGRAPAGRSSAARLDLTVRQSLYALAVLEPVPLTVWLFSFHSAGLTAPQHVLLALLCTVHTGACVTLLHRGLAHYLGQGPRPTRLVVTAVALTFLSGTTALVLQPDARLGSRSGLAVVAAGALAFSAGPLLIALPLRTAVDVIAGTGGAMCGAWLLSGRPATNVADFLVVAAIAGAVLGTDYRLSAWRLRALAALETAREVQARLAVMEERVRIARDLHDVMGRNLTTIALKSELAAELSRRGRPEAIDQMYAVQRIAHQAQREVRDLVHGYRAADLPTEIVGARSVLRAAGITCELDTAADVDPRVQPVLAWVVREGTTNVLRHSRATTCRIALHVTAAGPVRLEIANDGAKAVEPGHRGQGLKGLAERLLAADGTLSAEPSPDGWFRLAATVPVPADALPSPTTLRTMESP